VKIGNKEKSVSRRTATVALCISNAGSSSAGFFGLCAICVSVAKPLLVAPVQLENAEGVLSFSPGLPSLRGYPGLSIQYHSSSMPRSCGASRSPDSSGRAHQYLPSKPKPPLSDYEKALSEGKSHLEALYAQFTPTPEELERRKRANEELRHPSGIPIYEPPTAQQPSTPNPQKFYGPCSSPYTWQGHRPLDNWKVHTS
jgi:hypothetical protein